MRTPSTPRQDKHPPSRGYDPSTKIRCRSELEAQGACLTWCCCMIARLPASVSVCALSEVSRWTFAARIADLRWQRSFVVLLCLGRTWRWRFCTGRLAAGRTTDESRWREGKMRRGNQSTLSMHLGMASVLDCRSVCDSVQFTGEFNSMERAYSIYLPWYLDDSMYISALLLMQQRFFLSPAALYSLQVLPSFYSISTQSHSFVQLICSFKLILLSIFTSFKLISRPTILFFFHQTSRCNSLALSLLSPFLPLWLLPLCLRRTRLLLLPPSLLAILPLSLLVCSVLCVVLVQC